MLASDSDSEFEYTNANNSKERYRRRDSNNSDESNDYCGLEGKLALGIADEDIKFYDGKSSPQNGSQYLMKVMAEKKSVPKVVRADMSKSKVMNMKSKDPDYIDQIGKIFNEDQKNIIGKCQNSISFLPSTKWREAAISSFSIIRSKLEHWHYKIESKEIRFNSNVILVSQKYCPTVISKPEHEQNKPSSNDPTHWLKFCYGNQYIKLAAEAAESSLEKNITEQKINNFFKDMYEESGLDFSEANGITSVGNGVLTISKDAGGDENAITCGNGDCASSELELTQDCKAKNVADRVVPADASDTDTSDVNKVKFNFTIGHRPLMNVIMQLSQSQLENLIKWNLMWLNSVGFVNECQGQWLYALLAAVCKPIDPGVMSDIRAIARIMIKTRNAVYSSNENLGEETCNEKISFQDENTINFMNTLSLFIYIIVDYFNQKDLAIV